MIPSAICIDFIYSFCVCTPVYQTKVHTIQVQHSDMYVLERKLFLQQGNGSLQNHIRILAVKGKEKFSLQCISVDIPEEDSRRSSLLISQSRLLENCAQLFLFPRISAAKTMRIRLVKTKKINV